MIFRPVACAKLAKREILSISGIPGPEYTVVPDWETADEWFSEVRSLVDVAIKQQIKVIIDDDNLLKDYALFDCEIPETYIEPVVYYLKEYKALKESNRIIDEQRSRAKLGALDVAGEKVMTPECPRCWKVFGLKDELKAHLNGKSCRDRSGRAKMPMLA